MYQNSPQWLQRMDYCNRIQGFINYAISNPRNISRNGIRCLGLLYIDGFNLSRSFAAPYFYWLVILMVYNLLSRMCIKLKFMFLYTIIPGFNSPGRNIDIYLRLSIDELKQLWLFKALTYNILRKQNVLIKVTLM